MEKETVSILIIEDNPADAYLIQALLDESLFQKFHYKHTDYLKTALEFITAQKFDIILLDIGLPDTVGLEAIEKINKINHSIPIIVLTGNNQNLGLQVLKLGAQDYLTKGELNSELLIRSIKYSIERKKMVEQLRTQAIELSELNKTKDKFFSIISHDLKSPFQGLLGFSEVLVNSIDKFSSEEIKTYSEIIHETVRNIYNLIENLLQWSRLQTGRIEFRPEKINLSKKVNEIFQLFKNISVEKKINLVNEIGDTIYVYSDQYMLSSIVQNLISNAIKFTPESGLIKVTAKEEENLIFTSVIDSGIGIEEREIEKLFRYDSLFSKSGTKGERGTGLGLLICKELLDKNGGKIYIESKPGIGSEFIFTLPSCNNHP